MNRASWKCTCGLSPMSAPGSGRSQPLVAADRSGRAMVANCFMSVGAGSGALMSVSVEPGATWRAGIPTKLFEGQYFVLGGFSFRHYDVSPDGQRFLMIKEVSGIRPRHPQASSSCRTGWRS